MIIREDEGKRENLLKGLILQLFLDMVPSSSADNIPRALIGCFWENDNSCKATRPVNKS